MKPGAEKVQRGFWQGHPLHQGSPCCGESCLEIVSSLCKLLPQGGKPEVPFGCCSRLLQPSQLWCVLSGSQIHFPQTVSFGSQRAGNARGYDRLLLNSTILPLGTRCLCLLFFLAAQSKKGTEKKKVLFLTKLELLFIS